MSMTVGQLCEALDGMDSDTLVVLAKDGEGNGFSPLAESGHEHYLAYSTWSGAVGEAVEGSVPAVVLWPTN